MVVVALFRGIVNAAGKLFLAGPERSRMSGVRSGGFASQRRQSGKRRWHYQAVDLIIQSFFPGEQRRDDSDKR